MMYCTRKEICASTVQKVLLVRVFVCENAISDEQKSINQ